MKDKRTTIAGVLTILAALVSAAASAIHGDPVAMAPLTTALVSGIGLILAGDSKSGDVK
jgi:hypothetical protein